MTAKGKLRAEAYDNKLEAAWAGELALMLRAGAIKWWAYHAMKFRLADGAWYTPDFVGMDGATDEIILWETKGFMREPARLRLLFVAEKYPFKVLLVRHVKGRWQIDEVGSTGTRG